MFFFVGASLVHNTTHLIHPYYQPVVEFTVVNRSQFGSRHLGIGLPRHGHMDEPHAEAALGHGPRIADTTIVVASGRNTTFTVAEPACEAGISKSMRTDDVGGMEIEVHSRLSRC